MSSLESMCMHISMGYGVSMLQAPKDKVDSTNIDPSGFFQTDPVVLKLLMDRTGGTAKNHLLVT